MCRRVKQFLIALIVILAIWVYLQGWNGGYNVMIQKITSPPSPPFEVLAKSVFLKPFLVPMNIQLQNLKTKYRIAAQAVKRE